MQKDTEQLILDTARKHFVQKGFAAARMQEIADDAGINKAMLHYYFRSKERLYQEIIRRTLSRVVPKFAGAMAHEGSFRERLEHVVDTYISTLMENPDIPIFIMSELSQKRESFIAELKKQASFFPAVQSFMGQMQQEMEQGSIRQMPPPHLLLNILGMSVFPFMAKPVFRTIFEVSEKEFELLMSERKQIIADFVVAALRPG